jgi:hypothetical protein
MRSSIKADPSGPKGYRVEDREAAVHRDGMANADRDEALHTCYGLGGERDRLAEARGSLEFERTKEIVLRRTTQR